jgi:hypothetical protein
MKDLKTLIKESHEIAVSKGWHDTPVPFEVSIANIHAECAEAWEDYRNNRRLDEIYWECKLTGGCQGQEEVGGCDDCQYHKPCGIPVELADTVIRICDTLGANAVVPDDLRVYALHRNCPDSFPKLINLCHRILSKTDEPSSFGFDYLFTVIRVIEVYCQKNNIDLNRAIALKTAFNKLRPTRHGGKRA